MVAYGHTHLPEVRDLGWKVIVNDGSAGWIFDGDPTASWAMVDIAGDNVTAEIKRVPFDVAGRVECPVGARAARGGT